MSATKRITLSVRINVSLTVEATQGEDGEVDIVKVISMSGLPAPHEVIEALDGDGDLTQLDEEYEKAKS